MSRSFLLLVTTILAANVSADVAHAADAAAPKAIVLEQRGYGWRLTDQQGMVLYVSSRDTEPGQSKCVAACAATWLPVAAPADEKAGGEWSKVQRDGNTFQWAFRGSPLYQYTGDKRKGDATGEGLERGAWKVAIKPLVMPSGVNVVSGQMGYVLSDFRGMTLYVSDRDRNGKPAACDLKCARDWLPQVAPWSAISEGDWSVVDGSDGSKQWAYKGRPLYVYRGEINSGEALGESADKAFHAVVLEKPSPVPSWVTVQASPSNLDIYGDPNGMTLYAHIENTVETFASSGGLMGVREGVLRPQDWKPVVAGADDKDVGDWSVLTRKDGTRQWAYKGAALYTNVNDKAPGDLHGVRRNDLTFRPISVTGKPIAGTGI